MCPVVLHLLTNKDCDKRNFPPVTGCITCLAARSALVYTYKIYFMCISCWKIILIHVGKIQGTCSWRMEASDFFRDTRTVEPRHSYTFYFHFFPKTNNVNWIYLFQTHTWLLIFTLRKDFNLSTYSIHDFIIIFFNQWMFRHLIILSNGKYINKIKTNFSRNATEKNSSFLFWFPQQSDVFGDWERGGGRPTSPIPLWVLLSNIWTSNHAPHSVWTAFWSWKFHYSIDENYLQS